MAFRVGEEADVVGERWALLVVRELLLGPQRFSGPHAVYRLELDDRVWTVRTEDGRVHVEPGEPAQAHASLRTDPATLNAGLADPTTLAAAVATGKVAVAGDETALHRLLQKGPSDGS